MHLSGLGHSMAGLGHLRRLKDGSFAYPSSLSIILLLLLMVSGIKFEYTVENFFCEFYEQSLLKITSAVYGTPLNHYIELLLMVLGNKVGQAESPLAIFTKRVTRNCLTTFFFHWQIFFLQDTQLSIAIEEGLNSHLYLSSPRGCTILFV